MEWSLPEGWSLLTPDLRAYFQPPDRAGQSAWQLILPGTTIIQCSRQFGGQILQVPCCLEGKQLWGSCKDWVWVTYGSNLPINVTSTGLSPFLPPSSIPEETFWDHLLNEPLELKCSSKNLFLQETQPKTVDKRSGPMKQSLGMAPSPPIWQQGLYLCFWC